MTELLLSSGSWVVDLMFFLILVLGTALGAYRGFVSGVCKLAGKIASLIFAFVFCISFANFLETCFHMTSAIADGIAGSIAKNELYAQPLTTNISGAELEGFLGGMELNGIATWLMLRSFARVELIPAGTTPAMMLGSILAKWISVVIAFILLILIVRLGVWGITKTFGALKDAGASIRVVDQVLGAILGLAKALFWIFVVLLVCNWLPFDGLQEFISTSAVVGPIYRSEWFQSATSYAISGVWFDEYVKDLIIPAQ